MIRVKTEDMETGGAGAVAREGIFLQREIGRIWITCYNETNCRIQQFHVKDGHRRKGIGRKLLKEVERKLRKKGYTTMEVYPCPESFDDEVDISIEELYIMYGKLGFELEDKKADLSERNHMMKKKIG